MWETQILTLRRDPLETMLLELVVEPESGESTVPSQGPAQEQSRAPASLSATAVWFRGGATARRVASTPPGEEQGRRKDTVRRRHPVGRWHHRVRTVTHTLVGARRRERRARYLFCQPCRRGSAVAKIIGNNVKKLQKFASTVKMWVFEETVNGRKLTDIINNDHENVKYLPGHKLPENVVAVSNLSEAVQDADLLVFVIPHQFIHRICDEITGRVPKGALGITLIKGIDEGPEGLKLISDIIREKMGIDISVLMGANIANEVAAEKFCETTIGSKVMEHGLLFKELLQTPNFRITVVDDADTVELCGALKNIVAVGAGFCDGLRCGDNTKAAVIRLGLMEMIAFARIFCKGQVSTATFLESCGVADLITTCYGGRNRRVAEAFARTGKTIEELEKEMLNGQKLQGPQTSAEVYRILKQKGLIDKLLFGDLAFSSRCLDHSDRQESAPGPN
ncbi:Glycerol-3-phosphate dehydrogenase 1-like protein [Tupaia chinensis]|uniref:Glycerol-3-phosphate dehydrogenase [NAD(+)] n=1 Tax=Tupaia chinensis TaxID=246437 RepID=L9JC57_TUPCH|nr:Glycerol-3-phosphate dehydrogenase 1-like protein [Tupaia chinensis]